MKFKTHLAGWLTALVLLTASVGARAEPVMDSQTIAEVRAAIEKHWNMPSGVEHAERYTVMLRLHMSPDGVVTKIDVLDDSGDPGFRTLAESARRAVLITQKELGRLPIPADQYQPTIVVRWSMKQICEQYGGC